MVFPESCVPTDQVRATQADSATPVANDIGQWPGLHPVELTIVTSWADALAEAVVRAPERVGEVVADASPEAPWRRMLGVVEPSSALAGAITALATTVSGVDTCPGHRTGTTGAALLSLLRSMGLDGDPLADSARTVLRSAPEARDPGSGMLGRP